MDVVFEFDADLLAGKKLVAFEKLLRNDIEIYRCRDLIDKTPHYQAYLAQVNAIKGKYERIPLTATSTCQPIPSPPSPTRSPTRTSSQAMSTRLQVS